MRGGAERKFGCAGRRGSTPRRGAGRSGLVAAAKEKVRAPHDKVTLRGETCGGKPGPDYGTGVTASSGVGRGALLHLLAAPATTTELARRTGMSAGNVSQHLAALHAAGLVSRSREGRHVRYGNTDAATVLLRASGGA
ncbi:helix-turn-helix domain-containing protein [Micromonospora fulviviridis]|uniref:ArsR/SmtB family transcription factor n=1 Tax=Micromonospora fulviviridis TaxID=47860 RepID=UPI0033F292B2